MSAVKATSAQIKQYYELLAHTTPRITACASALDDVQLAQRAGPRTWSGVEVLAHLRACSDVWSHSIYAMLAEDNPTLPLLDERKWAKVTRYGELGFHPSLRAFASQREQLLSVLRQLPADAWEKTATIGGRRHSVFSQVRRMALHEAEHCTQIETMYQ